MRATYTHGIHEILSTGGHRSRLGWSRDSGNNQQPHNVKVKACEPKPNNISIALRQVVLINLLHSAKHDKQFVENIRIRNMPI